MLEPIWLYSCTRVLVCLLSFWYVFSVSLLFLSLAPLLLSLSESLAPESQPPWLAKIRDMEILLLYCSVVYSQWWKIWQMHMNGTRRLLSISIGRSIAVFRPSNPLFWTPWAGQSQNFVGKSGIKAWDSFIMEKLLNRHRKDLAVRTWTK